MIDQKLKTSFAKAFPGPGHIRVQPAMRRNAITALGVHCLFIDAGFVPNQSQQGDSSTLRELFNWLFRDKTVQHSPPTYWLSLLPSPEFIFRYKYPGKIGTFVLHCSVKPGTEQMLVRVCEELTPSEIIQFARLMVSGQP